jgi:hypothetical protein
MPMPKGLIEKISALLDIELPAWTADRLGRIRGGKEDHGNCYRQAEPGASAAALLGPRRAR